MLCANVVKACWVSIMLFGGVRACHCWHLKARHRRCYELTFTHVFSFVHIWWDGFCEHHSDAVVVVLPRCNKLVAKGGPAA
jgi:hypothetical protein